MFRRRDRKRLRAWRVWRCAFRSATSWRSLRSASRVCAELFERRFVFEALSIFRESHKRDDVRASQFAQEMEGALIRAAVERIRDVGIDHQQFHGSAKPAPKVLIRGDQLIEVAGARD